jgi:hypothetical protein
MAADFKRLESHRSLILDQDCVVVGSAPNRVLPVVAGPLITVQGSQVGLDLVPDLAVFSGHTTKGSSVVARDTMAGIRGLKARSVVFIEKGQSEEGAFRSFAAAGYRFRKMTTISPVTRAQLLRIVCGIEAEETCSNGVFAIALALYLGASTVTLAGFSLSGGHHYRSAFADRQHVLEDSRFFSLLTCCEQTCQRRATSAMTAPGASVSATICALASSDHRRRRPGPVSTSTRRYPPPLASSLTSTIMPARSSPPEGEAAQHRHA